MQWIKDLHLKDINGPTLYITIISAVVMVAVQGLGWHLNSTTVIGFFSIVGAFIWNNGKFGYKAVHTTNFWVTVISGLLLILNKGLGWNVSSQYVIGAIGLVISILFHNAHASGFLAKLRHALPADSASTAAPAPNSIPASTPTKEG